MKIALQFIASGLVGLAVFTLVLGGALLLVGVTDDRCVQRAALELDEVRDDGTVDGGLVCNVLGETRVTDTSSEGVSVSRSSSASGFAITGSILLASFGAGILAFAKVAEWTTRGSRPYQAE